MRSNDDSLPFFEAWFTENVDVDRRVSVSTYSFVTIPHMVVGTELVGTVHSRLARKLERALPIVVRPVPLPVLRFSQTMQWHKYRTQDPGLMWLRGLLHEAARTLDDAQA
ncbi:hypothetical protein [Hydrogenophaga sp. 5NK40-0174]|uniref:hypothetical protein n=1 Tax=Hydrogenophaga sp. 5NK40-0174 TaxID=3127649 RepID=UPI0031039940